MCSSDIGVPCGTSDAGVDGPCISYGDGSGLFHHMLCDQATQAQTLSGSFSTMGCTTTTTVMGRELCVVHAPNVTIEGLTLSGPIPLVVVADTVSVMRHDHRREQQRR